MSLRILPQDQLAQSSTTIVPFFLPESTPPYTARANRFNELAPGHALEAYLRLCAAICHAQAAAAGAVDVAAPAREQRYWDQCALHDLPPLGSFCSAASFYFPALRPPHQVKDLRENPRLCGTKQLFKGSGNCFPEPFLCSAGRPCACLFQPSFFSIVKILLPFSWR